MFYEISVFLSFVILWRIARVFNLLKEINATL